MKRLLDRGADPNGRDLGDEFAPQDRPLLTAASRGDTAIVDLLLAAGANPNWCCCSCVTALHHAIRGRHTAVVARLLDKGASPRLGAESPLELARLSGVQAIVELLEKKLREAGASPPHPPARTANASPRR